MEECPICYNEDQLTKFENDECCHKYCANCLTQIKKCALCREFRKDYIEEQVYYHIGVILNSETDNIMQLIESDFEIMEQIRVENDYCDYTIKYCKETDELRVIGDVFLDYFVCETDESYPFDWKCPEEPKIILRKLKCVRVLKIYGII